MSTYPCTRDSTQNDAAELKRVVTEGGGSSGLPTSPPDHGALFKKEINPNNPVGMPYQPPKRLSK